MTSTHPATGLRPAALCVLVAALLLSAACAEPCVNDSECSTYSYCGEAGVCQSDCVNSNDCEDGSFCTNQGQCFTGSTPRLTLVEPATGTVSGRFQIRVASEFAGSELNVSLTRTEDDAGAPCSPFLARTATVLGGGGDITQADIVFDDVAPAGRNFTLLLTAQTPTSNPEQLRIPVRAPDFLALEALSLSSPVSADVGSTEIAVPLEVRFASAGEYWARIEPMFGIPGPFHPVGDGPAITAPGRFLLSRGPQILAIQNGLSSDEVRCEIALDNGPGEGGLEVSMAFQSSESTDADLVIVSEREGVVRRCSDTLGGDCSAREGTRGLFLSGDRRRAVASIDGVYGVAVVPRAVAGAVSATVQVAHKSSHIGFLGPAVLQSDLGETWLVARLHVVNGALTVETLDTFAVGLPTGRPTEW